MRKRAALILLSMMVAVSLNAQGIDEYRTTEVAWQHSSENRAEEETNKTGCSYDDLRQITNVYQTNNQRITNTK